MNDLHIRSLGLVILFGLTAILSFLNYKKTISKTQKFWQVKTFEQVQWLISSSVSAGLVIWAAFFIP